MNALTFCLTKTIYTSSGYLPYYCTGFLAFHSTINMKKLLLLWQEKQVLLQTANQLTFQQAVIESKAYGKPLSIELFPCGQLFFEQMTQEKRNQAVVIHNNFIIGKFKKIHRFKYFDLWLVDQNGEYRPAK